MTDETPDWYSIEKLLSQSVQPFPDLPPDEFEQLKQSIKRQGLLNPILLSCDEYLFDGHQRLKALLALGRKRIAAKDVRIDPEANRENMLGRAYTSNLVRRMMSTEEKVQRMHQCVKLGWSQRRIAKEFHVTQPAVSQLMAAYPLHVDDTPPLLITHGEDNKTYTRVPRERKPVPNTWSGDGVAYRSVRRAHKFIASEQPRDLDTFETTKLAEELEDLREAIDQFLVWLEQ